MVGMVTCTAYFDEENILNEVFTCTAGKGPILMMSDVNPYILKNRYANYGSILTSVTCNV